MTDTNALPYYPRFIFNCDDGNILSTGDLDQFKFIKESGNKYDISRFKKGQEIDITWAGGEDQVNVKSYVVKSIEIHQIKYDLDAATYGINLDDANQIIGKEKKWMMEIYIFLTVKK